MYTKPLMLIKSSSKQWKSNSFLCKEVQANLFAAEPQHLHNPGDAQGPYEDCPTQQSEEALWVSCASNIQFTFGGCKGSIFTEQLAAETQASIPPGAITAPCTPLELNFTLPNVHV